MLTDPARIYGLRALRRARNDDPTEEVGHWASRNLGHPKKPTHLDTEREAPVQAMPGLPVDPAVGPAVCSRALLRYSAGLLYHLWLTLLAQGEDIDNQKMKKKIAYFIIFE